MLCKNTNKISEKAVWTWSGEAIWLAFDTQFRRADSAPRGDVTRRPAAGARIYVSNYRQWRFFPYRDFSEFRQCRHACSGVPYTDWKANKATSATSDPWFRPN